MRLFAVMTSNMNSPEYQALDREWQPKLAAADDAIAFDARLFKRVEAVHASAAAAGLAPDQQRLTSVTYDGFVRQGAKLDGAGKAKLGRSTRHWPALFSEFATRSSPTRTRGSPWTAKRISPASRNRSSRPARPRPRNAGSPANGPS